MDCGSNSKRLHYSAIKRCNLVISIFLRRDKNKCPNKTSEVPTLSAWTPNYSCHYNVINIKHSHINVVVAAGCVLGHDSGLCGDLSGPCVWERTGLRSPVSSPQSGGASCHGLRPTSCPGEPGRSDVLQEAEKGQTPPAGQYHFALSLWWLQSTGPDWRIAPIRGGWMWCHNVLQEKGELIMNRERWIVCNRWLDSAFRMTRYASRRNLLSSTSSSLTSKHPLFLDKKI